MVSSYIGRPILHALLIWNHFTAAFLRYGTLIHLEDYKDHIFNKYNKWTSEGTRTQIRFERITILFYAKQTKSPKRAASGFFCDYEMFYFYF